MTATRERAVADVVDNALTLLEATKSISLSEVTVVGAYRRYDEQIRNDLKGWHHRMVAPLLSPTTDAESFLIWARPGTGKTFFVEQSARSLSACTIVEIDLARDSKDKVQSSLGTLKADEGATFCLIDEIDARSDELWPYEVIFPWLHLNKSHDRTVVFALVGSSREGLPQMIEAIRGRSKGRDLIDRIDAGHRFTIPDPTLEDRMVIALSASYESDKSREVPITQVEKTALYFLLTFPELDTVRQIQTPVTKAVRRVPPGESGLRYRDLFHSDDPNLEEFFAVHSDAMSRLRNTFVRIVP